MTSALIPAITRRGLLKFAGGLAAGAFASPLPWTLLDDLSIWTQNRDAIARLPRGEVTTRFSICSLCPAACGVRLRCVAGRPFAVTGAAAHPVSRGRLCPFGFAAHQLPWHPSRVVAPLRRDDDGGLRAASAGEAAAAIAAAVAAAPGAFAIVDGRPGRALSAQHRRLAAALGGHYVAAVPAEEAVPAALGSMSAAPYGPLGWDLENTRLVVSFGAPLFESWGGPGRILDRRFGSDGGLRVIQVESRPSRTALLADRWIAPRPGTGITVAFGLAHLLAREGAGAAGRAGVLDLGGLPGRDFASLVAPFAPERVAGITGIAPEVMESVARELRESGPAIVVLGGDALEGPEATGAAMLVAALNVLIGAVGAPGGLVPRRGLPGPGGNDAAGSDAAGNHAAGDATPADGGLDAIERLPGESLRAVILDGEPGPAARAALDRALAPGAVVVSLSAHLVGPAASARFIVPAPAWLEAVEDMATPPGSPRALYGVTARVLDPPPGVVDPAAFIAAVARAAGLGGEWPATTELLVAERARGLAAAGRGRVVRLADGAGGAPAGGDGLLAQLLEGAVWEDDPVETPPPPIRLLGDDPGRLARLGRMAIDPAGGSEVIAASYPLLLVPFRDPQAQGRVLPTLASKIYRESDLLPSAGCALVHPGTAAAAGLRAGRRIEIETPHGAITARLQIDPAIAPGTIHFATGPGPGQLGEAAAEGPGMSFTRSAGAAVTRPVRARLRAVSRGGRRT